MRDQSLKKPSYASQWLTTGDVARMLERSAWSVRWMARTGRLSCETTRSGQHLFRTDEVLRLVKERATARLRSVYIGRARLLGVRGGPRQISLFRPRLELIHGGVDMPRGFAKKSNGIR